MRKILLILTLLVGFISNAQIVIAGGGTYTIPSATLEGNLLKITGSPDIDLSGYLDNTDNQTITDFSLSGTTLTLTLSGGNTKTLDIGAISGGLGSDGDKGDITVGGSGTTLTINNASITTAKIGEGQVSSLNIEDGTISESDISVSNSGTAGYSLVSDGTGGFSFDDVTSKTEVVWSNASTRDLTLDDAGTIIKSSSSSNYILTIPLNDDVAYGKDVAVTFLATNTGIISVKAADGVTFTPGQTATTGVPITIARNGIDNWIWLGQPDPYFNNIYTESNVLSLTGETDSYGTISFIQGSGTGTVSKPATGGWDGGRYYDIAGGSSSSTNERMSIPWSGAAIGDVIEVSYYVKIGTYDLQRTTAPTGLTNVDGSAFVQDTYTTETSWTKVEYTVKASATSGTWNIYSGGTGGISVDGFVMNNLGQ